MFAGYLQAAAHIGLDGVHGLEGRRFVATFPAFEAED